MRAIIPSLILLFLILNFQPAGSVTADEAEPYGYQEYFESDPAPVEIKITGDPLDYAMKRIGLDLDTFSLPRAWENNYRTVARFPIIDQVSENPLYMKVWAENTAHLIIESHQHNFNHAVQGAITILRGTSTPSGVGKGSYFYFSDWLDENGVDWPYTPGFREIVNDLLFSLSVARISIRGGRMNLNDSDLRFFEKNPGYYLTPDGKKMPSLTGSTATQLEFIDRARKLDIDAILTGSGAVANAVQKYYENAGILKSADVFYKGADTTLTTVFETPLGNVVIGGYGADTLTEDAFVIIELGGDDLYLNRPGGCDSPDDEVVVCIDQAGDDTYEANGQPYTQGFGFMGAGILADFAGNDTYHAGHFAQGGAILGAGFLWDMGGDDKFTADAFCQGAGMFGLGMLLNSAGNDFYDCATIGQGVATTLGIGILSDLSGSDKYHLAVREDADALGQMPGYGQGGALSFRSYPWKGELTPYGGIGMLIDNAGDDRYLSKGWCVQGGSYILSLGVLFDNAGNDRYEAQTGQGSGIHITNAILIDKAGDDYYKGGFRSGGSAGDRSSAFLIDYDGNDTYESKTSSYGTAVKPYAFSLFVDYKGDDRYVCGEPKGPITFNNWDSFGGVWPESEPWQWPYAAALDLGGNDLYNVRNHANGSERHSFGHGIHVDQEYIGEDLIPVRHGPFLPYERQPLPDRIKVSSSAYLFNGLQSPSLFKRFRVIWQLKSKGLTIIPDLVMILNESIHRQNIRDLLELLHYVLYENELFPEDVDLLQRLLRADDNEVRIVLVDDFRVWDLNPDDRDLVTVCAKDNNADVRRFALRTLTSMNSKNGLGIASEMALADPSPMVRRQAVVYLDEVGDPDQIFQFLSLLLRDETDPIVKVALADALGKTGNPDAVEILNQYKETFDPYLKRAVGRSLCELGQIEGLDLLIESLAFPSIDAFVNYNNNIPNAIAAYAGHDLPENKRYDRTAWQKWLDNNRGSINLEENAASYKEYRRFKKGLSGLSQAQQIGRYEDFLESHPANPQAVNGLAEKLNQIAWEMVTAPEDSPAFDPVLGLKYARRATELKHDPNYFDTYAEALMVNGDIDEAKRLCRDMLELYPDNEMFKTRLEKIEKMFK